MPRDYHLVMTNSSPWKITIFKYFLTGKPSINGPSIPWRTVSHNQRVLMGLSRHTENRIMMAKVIRSDGLATLGSLRMV